MGDLGVPQEHSQEKNPALTTHLNQRTQKYPGNKNIASHFLSSFDPSGVREGS
jgi:hypothetical protein